MTERKSRVLIGNIGLGGHELGAIYVSHILRDAGIEVIYLGLGQSPESILAAVIQEDIDIIGVSSMSAVHNELMPGLMESLKKNGLSHIPVIIGGIIPRNDEVELKKMGVREVFGPGTPGPRIVESIKSLLKQ